MFKDGTGNADAIDWSFFENPKGLSQIVMGSNGTFFTAKTDLYYSSMTTIENHVFCKSTGFVILLPHWQKSCLYQVCSVPQNTKHSENPQKNSLCIQGVIPHLWIGSFQQSLKKHFCETAVAASILLCRKKFWQNTSREAKQGLNSSWLGTKVWEMKRR